MSKHTKKDLIFFAYQGRRSGLADENVEAIRRAIKEFNHHQKTYVAKSWEEYSKSTVISKEVMRAISTSKIFVADLTYFNHNVLFELGYAIAKDKKILLLLNGKISGANEKYKEFILKTIRYTELLNAKSITTALQKKHFQENLLKEFVKIKNVATNSNDIFYKQSKYQNQISLDLSDEIYKYKDRHSLNIISEDYSEIRYQPLDWYFQNIAKSKIVLIHFLGQEVENSFVENAKNSFYAGLACGMKKNVILVAPAKYKTPLDYTDIMIHYLESVDLIAGVEKWLDEKLRKVTKQITETKALKDQDDQESNLIKLGIGCEIAENEKRDLISYFVPTYSYDKAKLQKDIIITGRKGSGKSAIYIKLLDELKKDSLLYLVNLKPECDELLHQIEMSELFYSQASQRKFFATVWTLVILSKILEIIHERVLLKPPGVPLEKYEENIIQYVEKNEKYMGLDFIDVVNKISIDYGREKQNTPDVLELLYITYIGPIKKVVVDYVNNSKNVKYSKIVILADNLDKTWNVSENLDMQSEMILTLLEIKEKITKELRNLEVEPSIIIFLRKDIFSYIHGKSNEPDKLISSSHEIEWEKYPNKLKELVENRFRHILDLSQADDLDENAWFKYFEFKKNKKTHPFEVIESIITKRPRDLIYFLSKLFESAVNKGHRKVNDDDLESAIFEYTTFLNSNLIAETRAIFPEIDQILSSLHEYRGNQIEYRMFEKIVKAFGYNKDKIQSFVETLFDKGYMVGFDENKKKSFAKYSILKDKLQERKYGIFKNRVYVITHAKYYFIKNKIAF